MSNSVNNNVSINGEGNNVSTSAVFGAGEGSAQPSGWLPPGTRIAFEGDGQSISVGGGVAAPTGRPATGNASGPESSGTTAAPGATGHNPPTGAASANHPFTHAAIVPSVRAPQLLEGATYAAHLHNLEQVGLDADRSHTTAETTLSSATQAQYRAERAMAGLELMAQGLAAQDFGEAHVANMHALQELFALQARHAATAVQAAQESLDASEQVAETVRYAVAAFRRDHENLNDTYASAPHPAKSRDAYRPM